MIAFVLVTRAPRAIERMALPSFPLAATDGRTVSTEWLVRPGRWLLVYIEPNCGPCEKILRMIKNDEHPRVAERLVIVVGAATPDAVRAGSAQLPDLAASGWYADPTRAAIVPLKLAGAPVIFGMDAGMIEWSLYGVLSDSGDVKSALASWVETSP
jgi:hypothetical protein